MFLIPPPEEASSVLQIGRKRGDGMIKWVVIELLRVYQWLLSPWLGPRCRFYPSCSSYAMEAVRRHGVGRGLELTLRRLLKCHPFHPGGIDEVPPPVRTAYHRQLKN